MAVRGSCVNGEFNNCEVRIRYIHTYCCCYSITFINIQNNSTTTMVICEWSLNNQISFSFQRYYFNLPSVAKQVRFQGILVSVCRLTPSIAFLSFFNFLISLSICDNFSSPSSIRLFLLATCFLTSVSCRRPSEKTNIQSTTLF